jgi:hypothetical protein
LSDNGVTLPESLVAELIEKVGKIGKAVDETFNDLAKRREALRDRLLEDKVISNKVVSADAKSDMVCVAVDGACLVEVDRASSYGIACVARVGPDQSYSDHRSNMFVLPHVVGIDGLANGFMMMQEIMMVVDTARQHPQCLAFLDGSKISFIIKMNQFYSIFKDEGVRDFLDTWRKPNNKSDAAMILRDFESRNWFADLFGLSNIVGNLKLVTTDVLIKKYLPEYKGRFDDKTLAALVLEPGERTRALPLNNPAGEGNAPYHMSEAYPFNRDFGEISKMLVDTRSSHRITHSYFRAASNDSIYKLEATPDIGADRYDEMFIWVNDQSCAIDLMEPYPMYVVDRFVKEAVSVSKEAIHEIMRSQSTSDWSLYFTAPHRTT